MRSQKSVHELAEEVGGMYALVVAAAKRAKQIREGRQPVTSTDSSNPLTIALQELLDGKIVVRPPGEKDETEAGSDTGGEGEAETEEADDEKTAPEDE